MPLNYCNVYIVLHTVKPSRSSRSWRSVRIPLLDVNPWWLNPNIQAIQSLTNTPSHPLTPLSIRGCIAHAPLLLFSCFFFFRFLSPLFWALPKKKTTPGWEISARVEICCFRATPRSRRWRCWCSLSLGGGTQHTACGKFWAWFTCWPCARLQSRDGNTTQ